MKPDCECVKICLWFAPSDVPPHGWQEEEPARQAAPDSGNCGNLKPGHCLRAAIPSGLRLSRTPCFAKYLPVVRRWGHWHQSHSQPGASACRSLSLVPAACDTPSFSCQSLELPEALELSHRDSHYFLTSGLLVAKFRRREDFWASFSSWNSVIVTLPLFCLLNLSPSSRQLSSAGPCSQD